MPEGLIEGKWKFSYSLANHLGQAGFSGRMIINYPDPVTGAARKLRNLDGMELPGYFFDKTSMIFDTKNPWDRKVVDWLVGHPEVGVVRKQTKLDEGYYSKKISNPRIKMVNLDHQDIEHLVEEDYIDKLVGIIVLDNGPKAIGLDKLRFILSKLNMQYRDERYTNDPATEKAQLRRKLKSYVRTSMPKAEEVNRILNNLEGAKKDYEIKEMIRLDILKVSNSGMYQYEGNPIGVSFESIIQYFDNNPEFHAELLKKMHEKNK